MKKMVFIVVTFALAAAQLAGCGQKKAPVESSGSTSSGASARASEPQAASGSGSESNEKAKTASNGAKQDSVDASGDDGAYDPTAWLPAGADKTLSESKADVKLQKAIAAYFNIPDTDLESTKYYYNYVDLNDDGTDEILALVIGPYTSGNAGDTLLWVLPNGDYTVIQELALANAPILVSDNMVNGAHELIAPRMGGGAATKYVSLTCSDGAYTAISDASAVSDLSLVKGTAILCNDIAKDMERGTALTLASK